jgi:hypothetical protein
MFMSLRLKYTAGADVMCEDAWGDTQAASIRHAVLPLCAIVCHCETITPNATPAIEHCRRPKIMQRLSVKNTNIESSFNVIQPAEAPSGAASQRASLMCYSRSEIVLIINTRF